MMTSDPRVWIFNGGTVRPYFPPVKSGITCLLIQAAAGLALVDTGFGLGDYTHPGRVMRLFLAAMRSPRSPEETALYQVRRLGFDPLDVRHILVTHLHLDHVGGLPDFPHASVHLYRPEYEHISSGRPGWEYVHDHWKHQPRWTPHDLAGDSWHGFPAICLDEIDPDIWLVPLAGHTPGHAAVAVRRSDRRWLLHGGDAVPFNAALNGPPDWISNTLLGPHTARIRAFSKAHPEVTVIGAHMNLAFYTRQEWDR